MLYFPHFLFTRPKTKNLQMENTQEDDSASNIVQQLRDLYATHPIVMKAADEIERLEGNRDQQHWPTAREESDRKRQVDTYGLALMMIREGCANPREVARKALDKFLEIYRPYVESR